MVKPDLTNYYVSPTGVISKLKDQWDKLNDISLQLDHISKKLVKKLFHYYAASLIIIIFTFGWNEDKNLCLSILFINFCFSLALSMFLYADYLIFISTKKKGRYIYKELRFELEENNQNYQDGEYSLNERMSLNNFLLSCELPLHFLFFTSLVILLPLLSFTFWTYFLLFFS